MQEQFRVYVICEVAAIRQHGVDALFDKQGRRSLIDAATIDHAVCGPFESVQNADTLRGWLDETHPDHRHVIEVVIETAKKETAQ